MWAFNYVLIINYKRRCNSIERNDTLWKWIIFRCFTYIYTHTYALCLLQHSLLHFSEWLRFMEDFIGCFPLRSHIVWFYQVLNIDREKYFYIRKYVRWCSDDAIMLLYAFGLKIIFNIICHCLYKFYIILSLKLLLYWYVSDVYKFDCKHVLAQTREYWHTNQGTVHTFLPNIQTFPDNFSCAQNHNYIQFTLEFPSDGHFQHFHRHAHFSFLSFFLLFKNFSCHLPNQMHLCSLMPRETDRGSTTLVGKKCKY